MTDTSSTPRVASTDQLRNWMTASYFAAFVALGLSVAAFGPALTELAANVDATLTQMGYAMSAGSLGYLLGSILGGWLYDRVRGNPVMATMLVLVAFGLAATPLVSVIWLLIGVNFLLGACQGAVDVGGNTLLVWLHRDKVDPFMNGMHFFFGLGAFASPIIIAQSISLTGGVRWAYWGLVVLLLPVIAMLFALPSPHATGRDGAQQRETRVVPHRPRLVVLIAIFFFFYVGAEISFGGWISAYAQATGIGDAATAAYVASAFYGALTLGRLLAIPFAARFAPRQILIADLSGCMVSVLLLVLLPGRPAVTWIGAFGVGLSMASIFPTMISWAERNTRITGAVTSVFFVGSSTGGMIVPWVIGQLFEGVGPQVTTVAIATSVVLAIGAFTMVNLMIQPQSSDSVSVT